MFSPSVRNFSKLGYSFKTLADSANIYLSERCVEHAGLHCDANVQLLVRVDEI